MCHVNKLLLYFNLLLVICDLAHIFVVVVVDVATRSGCPCTLKVTWSFHLELPNKVKCHRNKSHPLLSFEILTCRPTFTLKFLMSFSREYLELPINQFKENYLPTILRIDLFQSFLKPCVKHLLVAAS